MKKFTIELSEGTIEQINVVTTYENVKNTLLKNERSNSFNIEDFISGCVNYYLEQINTHTKLATSNGKLQNNFKQIMEQKGLKQVDLANITKISKGNLSGILSNRIQPSVDYFLRIWFALGRPPIEECFYRKF
jgi:DNA-binding XRE family transcriptional regulator